MASLSFAPNLPNGKRVTLAHIDAVVAVRLGPTRGLGKSQPACFNRQVAMYLANHVGRSSTPIIGRFYGGRDHSTVVHSIHRIEAMREVEPDLDALLCDLKSKLESDDHETAQPDTTCPIFRMPTSRELEIRLLAKELAAPLIELLREELRNFCDARDFRGAPGE